MQPSILCGTDFSEAANSALTAAAVLAARMRMPLHLIHSVELSEGPLREDSESAYVNGVRSRLEHQAERLRALGAQVTMHLGSGAADDALLEKAAELSAKLIVVAALGSRRPGKWQLGSHADRLAQCTHVPVLVVRDSEPFSAWAAGARPLRVAVGVDLSLASKAAMRWVEELRAFGACDVVAMHCYWPPTQFQRLGLLGARSYLDPDPQVSEVLERELQRHLALSHDMSAVKLRLEPHIGGIGERLASMAEQERADLVVVGSHERSAVARLWEGSASHGALHGSRSSVACIPAPARAEKDETPQLRSVVVATDFSPVGNAAIPLAYALAPREATVHLVHVLPIYIHDSVAPRDVLDATATAVDSDAGKLARRQLLELIPHADRGADRPSCVHILQSNEPAAAICQAAERLDADLLCVGTHGRGGLLRLMMGSVALAVVAQTRRPVLLAHGPRA